MRYGDLCMCQSFSLAPALQNVANDVYGTVHITHPILAIIADDGLRQMCSVLLTLWPMQKILPLGILNVVTSVPESQDMRPDTL